MKPRILSSSVLVVALIAAPGFAMAQDFGDDFGDEFNDDFDDDFDDFNDDFGDPEPSNSPGDASNSSNSGNSSNSAGERGLGVGAMAPLASLGGFVGGIFGAGPSVSYDMGDFHIDGVLLFASNGDTTFGLGGRFWYHLIEHDNSDFSAGGGFTFVNVNPDIGDSSNLIFLEAGAKIRMFLVPNVALSSSTGLVLGVGDADGVALAGQVIGGVTYYFD